MKHVWNRSLANYVVIFFFCYYIILLLLLLLAIVDHLEQKSCCRQHAWKIHAGSDNVLTYILTFIWHIKSRDPHLTKFCSYCWQTARTRRHPHMSKDPRADINGQSMIGHGCRRHVACSGKEATMDPNLFQPGTSCPFSHNLAKYGGPANWSALCAWLCRIKRAQSSDEPDFGCLVVPTTVTVKAGCCWVLFACPSQSVIWVRPAREIVCEWVTFRCVCLAASVW